jgi:(p)ppGpp synthase/HD superfamily hydrolase
MEVAGNMNLLNRAIEWSAVAHADQMRKGTSVPYITHPFAVGMLLAREGYSEEVIAAGILHDTLEDTSTTEEQLRELFGERVTAIVIGCSEPNKADSWENRKKHTLQYLESAPDEIRYVACADKLHNIRSMIEDHKKLGDNMWSKFKRGREQQEWYYRGLVDSLSQGSSFSLLAQLGDEVEHLFGPSTSKRLV